MAANGENPPPTNAFTADVVGCATFQIPYFKAFHIHYNIFLYIIAKMQEMHNRKMEKTLYRADSISARYGRMYRTGRGI